MKRRGNNHSTERALEEKNINPRVSYERKCHTPSGQHQNLKKSSTVALTQNRNQNNLRRSPIRLQNSKNIWTCIFRIYQI